jgi:acyl dehydratase
VPVASRASHVYSECARIWNPIHTDVAVARGAGLSDPILHGSATLALAVSEVIRRDLDGDPARVRAVAVRFTGMVPMPSRFQVRGLGRVDSVLGFDAVDERGDAVLSDGVVRA